MDLICVNTSVPAAAGAMFVVSEKGDILSPKMAPDTDIPATSAGLIPMPYPIAMKATPMVPSAEYADPVKKDTIQQTTNPKGRNEAGVKILSP